MAKRIGAAVPLGRLADTLRTVAHPERTAYRSGVGPFADYFFQEWPNRPAMARSIRMQQARAAQSTDWRPVVTLTDGEGY